MAQYIRIRISCPLAEVKRKEDLPLVGTKTIRGGDFRREKTTLQWTWTWWSDSPVIGFIKSCLSIQSNSGMCLDSTYAYVFGIFKRMSSTTVKRVLSVVHHHHLISCSSVCRLSTLLFIRQKLMQHVHTVFHLNYERLKCRYFQRNERRRYPRPDLGD